MTETLNLSQLIAEAEANGADFKKVRLDPTQKYRGEVTHMRYKVSKAGNPGFSVRLKIVEGPESNKSLWTDFYLTPIKKDGEKNTPGIQIFFRQTTALGFDTDDFKSGALNIESAVASSRAIGRVVDFEVEDHTWENETSSKIKSMRAVVAPQALSGQVSGFSPAAPVGYTTPVPDQPIRSTPF